MSEPNPIRVNMTVAESNQLVNMTLAESGEMFPMQHSEAVISTSTDYDDLFHKPSINGVELVGDLDSSDLGLQSALTFDDSPTQASSNPVKSGGVYTALGGKQDTLTFDNAPTEGSLNPVTSDGINATFLYALNTVADWLEDKADKSEIPTVPTNVSAFTNDSGYITGAQVPSNETDPTVPSWAKASTKPTYTASEVGALPDSTVIPSKTSDLTNDSGFITQASIPVQSVNGQTGAVVLDADDVGALPDTTAIPTKTSDLQNDSGYITGITGANVTAALGYTPYNATNPSGYVNATQAANAAPVQSVNGQTGSVLLTIPTVPTNVSAFTNDSGYLTLSTLPIYNGGVS